MKKLILAFACIAVGANVAVAQNEKPMPASIAIAADLPMANQKLQATDGHEYSLQSQMTDKGLLVMFSCNTCPYVIKSQNRTKEMMELAKQEGLGMVVINSNEAQRSDADSRANMRKYAADQHISVPYLIDAGPVADAFGATRTPEVFLFDAKGKLVYKGAMEDNPSNPSESKELYLAGAIRNMKAGKPIDPNTTKSIGCTIKRKS